MARSTGVQRPRPPARGSTSDLLRLDIDRSSPVPLYFQVAEGLAAAIERGDLPPGSRLENEVDLADRLGLSRPTMRRAIQELVAKGLLVRRRGVGTQVVLRRVERNVRLSSLFDDLVRAGQSPQTQVIQNKAVVIGERVAGKLGLRPGDSVRYLQRLRLADRVPLALMTNWLPATIGEFSNEQLESRGLYELLRGAGSRISVARQTISACAATADQARRLGVGKGAPLLAAERVAYDDHGDVIEFASHLYRADRYTFELTLVES